MFPKFSAADFLTLSYLQTHFDATAAENFWKHCGQRWICSSWAISPLATMFSTLFNNKAIFYGDFWGFCHYVSRFVCCRSVVCGEGLTCLCMRERGRYYDDIIKFKIWSSTCDFDNHFHIFQYWFQKLSATKANNVYQDIIESFIIK